MGIDHFLNLQPGTIINERYEIVKCLGAGSMGMVYACRHKELAGHVVAMKVLYSEVAQDEVAATRFKNEIFASYNVSHPNVVRAYEYFTDGDLTAFTMEFVGGGDLADKLEKGEHLEFEEIVEMLSAIAAGLGAIHEVGIIHRDIKPENILLTSQGGVKITDFGIARKIAGPRLTEHGGVVGTIDYVCPEYLELNQVDERSDLYSLGILAYEMTTLQSPFQGKSIIETMQMRLRESATEPKILREDCPPLLNDIIMKLMSRMPEDRYQTAKELLIDIDVLQKVLSGVDHSEIQTTEAAAEEKPEEITKVEEPTVDPKDSRAVLSAVLGPKKEQIRQEAPSASYSSFQDFAGRSESFDKTRAIQPNRGVDVSRGSIDNSRLKEMNSKGSFSDSFTYMKLMLWLAVLFIWLGLGLSLLNYYRPDLFDAAKRSVQQVEVDPEVIAPLANKSFS